MKFVATKTAEQLDLQALHRVRERLVSQRTGIINQIRAFHTTVHVRFGPKADKSEDISLSPLSAISGREQSQQNLRLFDHLVCARTGTSGLS
jgi:transposase